MTITIQNIIDTVRELANERPEFKYTDQGVHPETCSYLGRQLSEPEMGEACIFGQAFAKLGVGRNILVGFEGDSATAIANYATGITINKETGRWMSHIQQLQDGGHTWSTALQIANRQYPSV